MHPKMVPRFKKSVVILTSLSQSLWNSPYWHYFCNAYTGPSLSCPLIFVTSFLAQVKRSITTTEEWHSTQDSSRMFTHNDWQPGLQGTLLTSLPIEQLYCVKKSLTIAASYDHVPIWSWNWKYKVDSIHVPNWVKLGLLIGFDNEINTFSKV